MLWQTGNKKPKQKKKVLKSVITNKLYLYNQVLRHPLMLNVQTTDLKGVFRFIPISIGLVIDLTPGSYVRAKTSLLWMTAHSPAPAQ